MTISLRMQAITATFGTFAAELFALGHANSNGVAFSKSSIKSMLED